MSTDTQIVGKYSHLGMTAAQYKSVHEWVHRNFGKANRCEKCGTPTAPRYEWSNISHSYKRERSDWKMLCPSCHRKADYTDALRESVGMRSRKRVLQLTMDGLPIREWDSLRLAADETGTQYTSISANLRGRYKSAGGYKWEYAVAAIDKERRKV